MVLLSIEIYHNFIAAVLLQIIVYRQPKSDVVIQLSLYFPLRSNKDIQDSIFIVCNIKCWQRVLNSSAIELSIESCRWQRSVL